jgi:hypothetical protein
MPCKAIESNSNQLIHNYYGKYLIPTTRKYSLTWDNSHNYLPGKTFSYGLRKATQK